MLVDGHDFKIVEVMSKMIARLKRFRLLTCKAS
jgi:hypothetical protein